MPNPQRAPTISPNNAFSNQADQDVQYQESMFNWKVALLASGGGGVVDRSSDGVVADGSDNWVAATDVLIALAGAGAWIAMTLGGDYGGDTLHALLYTNDTPGNPQTFGLRFSTLPYTGGTIAALPTTLGFETVVNTSGDDIQPIAAGPTIPQRWTSWYTAQGDCFFGVKEEGVPGWHFFARLHAFTDADGGGKGGFRFGIYTSSSISDAALSLSLMANSTFWETLPPGGGFGNVPAEAHTTMLSVTSFPSGLDFNGELVDDVFNLFCDVATAGAARFIGQPPDTYSTDIDVAFGTLDDSESLQTFRRVVLGAGVIDYWPTGSLPVA